MHPVANRIKEILPHSLTEIGETALIAALELSYVQQQIPEKIHLAAAQSILKYGLYIALNRNNSSFDRHYQKILNCHGNPSETLPPSFFSEIEACYVLSQLGLQVTYVKTESHPTPDLKVALTESTFLDAEVARGETRQLHQEVEKGLEQLVGALAPATTDFHLLCYFADASRKDDLEAALEAVSELKANDVREEVGRWAVNAVPFDMREPGIDEAKSMPFWWPPNEPCLFVTHIMLGASPGATIKLTSLFPLTSYMNPIIRKAESGQYDASRPYLICLDCNELRRAHDRIQTEIAGYFSIWPHVSGVLLFETRFYLVTMEKKWIYSVHANPNAVHPLPPLFLSRSNGTQQQFSLHVTS